LDGCFVISLKQVQRENERCVRWNDGLWFAADFHQGDAFVLTFDPSSNFARLTSTLFAELP
jgi:hypothetical protein